MSSKLESAIVEYKAARRLESEKRDHVSEVLVKWAKRAVHFGTVGGVECSAKTGFTSRPVGVSKVELLDATPPYIDLVTKAMSFCEKDLLDAFSADWQAKHLMLVHSSLPTLPDPATLMCEACPCFKYGRCFCKDKPLYKLSRTFASMMRQAFHKDCQAVAASLC